MLKALLNLFKKKEISPIDKELKKYPRRDRERLKRLWEQWEKGEYLKINKK